MYYVFLALSSIFTLFIFHNVNKRSLPTRFSSLANEEIPSQFRCAIDAALISKQEFGANETRTSDLCRMHDKDALSEVIVAVKGPVTTSPAETGCGADRHV